MTEGRVDTHIIVGKPRIRDRLLIHVENALIDLF